MLFVFRIVRYAVVMAFVLDLLNAFRPSLISEGLTPAKQWVTTFFTGQPLFALLIIVVMAITTGGIMMLTGYYTDAFIGFCSMAMYFIIRHGLISLSGDTPVTTISALLIAIFLAAMTTIVYPKVRARYKKHNERQPAPGA